MVKLGDYVKNSSRKNKNGGCTAVYSVTNSQGFIPSTEYFSKEVYSKELGTYKLVDRGMIAYNPSRINVGSVALQDCVDQAIVSPLYVVFSVDDTRLSPEYVVRFLKSKPGLDQIAFRSIGTVRNNLKFDGLCQMDIAVPALEVQEQCVIALKGIESQKTLAEKYLSKLDELVKSRFVEMFGGDPVVNPKGFRRSTLGSVISVQPSNGLYKPQKDYVTDGTGHPIVRIDSFRPEGPDYVRLKRLNCTDAELTRYGLNDGDIVINRVNSIGCMGKTMLICDIPEPVVFESNMMRLHADESQILSAFLCAQMTSDYSKEYFESSAKRAIGQASINQTDVKQLPVLVPDLDIQNDYLAFVQQVDKLKYGGPSDICPIRVKCIG